MAETSRREEILKEVSRIWGYDNLSEDAHTRLEELTHIGDLVLREYQCITDPVMRIGAKLNHGEFYSTDIDASEGKVTIARQGLARVNDGDLRRSFFTFLKMVEDGSFTGDEVGELLRKKVLLSAEFSRPRAIETGNYHIESLDKLCALFDELKTFDLESNFNKAIKYAGELIEKYRRELKFALEQIRNNNAEPFVIEPFELGEALTLSPPRTQPIGPLDFSALSFSSEGSTAPPTPIKSDAPSPEISGPANVSTPSASSGGSAAPQAPSKSDASPPEIPEPVGVSTPSALPRGAYAWGEELLDSSPDEPSSQRRTGPPKASWLSDSDDESAGDSLQAPFVHILL